MNGLLTTTQAQELLNMSYKTLLKHIHSGQLKAYPIPSGSRIRYRIRLEDLDDFIRGAGGAHGRHNEKSK